MTNHASERKPIPNRLLRLLQLCDSGFPTGAFSFSNGLEGLTRLAPMRGEAELLAAITTQVEEGLAGVELPAVVQAHRAAADGDLARLLALDGVTSALKPVEAFRAASRKVGRRFLESAAPLLSDPFLDLYAAAVRQGDAPGHHAVAFGVALHAVGVDETTAALAFGAMGVQGQTAAAVRLGMIGQAAAQRLIDAIHPAVEAAVDFARRLDLDDFGAHQPMADIAGFRQRTLDGRLFAS